MYEMVSGQRMMTSYFRIGGLALDPPRGFFEKVKQFLDIFPEKVDEYENLLTGNRIFIDRLKNVAHISADDALAIGLTGPSLRPRGVGWDLPRDIPPFRHEKIKFKRPVSQEGEFWA